MPTPISINLLDKPNVDYIKAQIETGHAVRTKKALQHLCKLYRGGYRAQPRDRIGLEQSVVGLLYTQKGDEKIRRWALNALARLGLESTSMAVIEQVIKDHGHEPETTAAAIAAIYKISRRASAILKKLAFDEKMITLAALQHVDPKDLDLSALPLDVDAASPELLKLALVVVGLDRAPINLLNPRHDNAQMVKALGKHHDNIVSQYSIWAITENRSLGIGDLGVDIRTIEQQPANVRAWIFQLVAMTSENAQEHMEYITLGIRDSEVEARAGLALGLRDTFFAGLEVSVLDWITSEDDPDVNQNILDHLIRQASHCASYEAMAIELYERAGPGSPERQRMEANAAKTTLYGKFKRISYDGPNDLFRGGVSVVNNYNVSGGIQGGAVSLGGNADNSGTSSIHYNPQTVEAIQSELSKAEREIQKLTVDADLQRQALEHVHAAKADPTPEKISRAIDILGKMEDVAMKALGAGTAIATIGEALARAAGLM